jgi:hypothetical protein
MKGRRKSPGTAKAAVLVSKKEWDRLTKRKGTLAEFLQTRRCGSKLEYRHEEANGLSCDFPSDANVVSELAKTAANPGVLRFLTATAEDSTFLTVITLAELQYGIERCIRREARAVEELAGG